MLKAFYSLSFVVIIFSISLIGACSSEDVEREPECDGSLTISLDGAPVNPTTCSSTNGSVTVTAVGGTAPYQYSVNGGALQSSSTFSNLSQGTYTFTVIDKNDCEDVIEGITIEAPGSTLDLSANVTPDTNCSANNGTITLTGSGGNGTLTYRMGTDGFSASNQYQGLGPGNYSVSVKDEDGCTKTIAVTVTQGNTGTTYTGQIKDLVDTNCATNSSCHASGASGRRPELTTFTQVRDNAASILTEVKAGRMPRNAAALSNSQIALIECWINDGKPQ